MRAILTALLGQAPEALPSPFHRALGAAASASTVGAAFLAGYRAALRTLVPTLPEGREVCLCATEEGGAHPRAIATRLQPRDDREGYTLSGRKTWVTGAPLADLLLVVASLGSDETGRNRLRLVQVDARAPGVTVRPLPPTPFVPEIPHAGLTLDGVCVEEAAILPGDGYDRYLKPFRTVEDLHVFGAVLAYLFGMARRHDWPRPFAARMVTVLVALGAIATADPSAAETHLALAGAIDLGRELVVEAGGHFAALGKEARATWERDAGLLSVAERARRARTETAWTKVLGSPR